VTTGLYGSGRIFTFQLPHPWSLQVHAGYLTFSLKKLLYSTVSYHIYTTLLPQNNLQLHRYYLISNNENFTALNQAYIIIKKQFTTPFSLLGRLAAHESIIATNGPMKTSQLETWKLHSINSHHLKLQFVVIAQKHLPRLTICFLKKLGIVRRVGCNYMFLIFLIFLTIPKFAWGRFN